MKIMKKSLSIILTILMLISVMSVGITSASAATISTGTKFYLIPNSNWLQSNARFAAYFYNSSSNIWASMSDSNSDGIYEVSAPSGSWTSVILVRMNPSSSSNNWDNDWNQTANISYNGTHNCFAIKDGQWGDGTTGADSYWLTYTPKTVYFVNTYSWSNVYVHQWVTNGGSVYPGGKATKVTGTTDVYKAEIGFGSCLFNDNGSNKTGDLTTTANKYYEPKTAKWYDSAEAARDAALSRFYLAGTFNSWNTSDENFVLKESVYGKGDYTGTATLEPGTYEFKVYKDGIWYGNNGTLRDTIYSTSSVTKGWSFDSGYGENCTFVASGGDYVFALTKDTVETQKVHLVIDTPINTEAKLKNYIEDLNDTGVPSVTLADDIALENELAINKNNDEMDLDVTIIGGEHTISGSNINSSSTLTLNGGTYKSTVNVTDDTLTINGSATLDKVVLTNGANLTVAEDSTIKTLSVATLDALDNITNDGTIENIVVELTEDTTVDSDVTADALSVTGEGKTLTIVSGTYGTVKLLNNVSLVVDDGATVEKVAINPLNNNEITGYDGSIYDLNGDKVVTVEDDGNNFKLDRKYYYHSEIIGVQTRYQTDMRFIAAIDTDELKNAEDYGFVLIKSTKSNANLISAMAMTNDLISQEQMSKFTHYSCVGTDNIVAGDYGKYEPETSYKYVTAAVTGMEKADKDKVIVAMFYTKDSNDKYTYSNYYSSDSNIYNGIAASYNDAAGVPRPTD